MTHETPSLAQLTVVDMRSRFTTMGLGWRTDPGRHTEAEQLLRGAAKEATRQTPDLTPVSVEWTTTDGAVCMTAVVPPRASRQWMEAIINEAGKIPASHVDLPIAAAVGDPDNLQELDPLLKSLGPGALAPRNDKWPSRMRHSTIQGFEQTLVTGQDPAENAGGAATFLAICLLAGGPGTLMPEALQRDGHHASIQVMRSLQDRRAALTWQVIAQQGGGTLAALDTVLAAASSFRVSDNPGRIALARDFACGNLNRPWRSPIELARSLVHYEVMGWGGALVLAPEIELAQVDDATLADAVDRMVSPLREVLGRS